MKKLLIACLFITLLYPSSVIFKKPVLAQDMQNENVTKRRPDRSPPPNLSEVNSPQDSPFVQPEVTEVTTPPSFLVEIWDRLKVFILSIFTLPSASQTSRNP